MKTISAGLTIALLLLTGCTLPKHIADSIRVPRMKDMAIPATELEGCVEIRSQGSKQVDPARLNKVLVVARSPEEAVWTPPNIFGSRIQVLDAGIRHMAETAARSALLDKGFRAASRLSDIPVSKESAFMDNTAFSQVEQAIFRGELILVLTFEDLRIERVDYRATTWDGTYSADLGFQVRGHLSAELVTGSSETLWVGSAKVDRLVREKMSSSDVAGILARNVSKGLPQKN